MGVFVVLHGILLGLADKLSGNRQNVWTVEHFSNSYLLHAT